VVGTLLVRLLCGVLQAQQQHLEACEHKRVGGASEPRRERALLRAWCRLRCRH
jgi:hypothetical protein